MIQSIFLSELATYTGTVNTKVLVNDLIVINNPDFVLQHVIDNVYELKFSISSSQTTLITNIKLLESDDTVISNNEVNIPVQNNGEVIIRQTITYSEVNN